MRSIGSLDFVEWSDGAVKVRVADVRAVEMVLGDRCATDHERRLAVRINLQYSTHLGLLIHFPSYLVLAIMYYYASDVEAGA